MKSSIRFLSAVFTFLGVAFGSYKFYVVGVEENIRKIMEEAKQKAAFFGELNYGKVEFSLLKREFSVIGVTFKPHSTETKMELRKISFDQFSYKDLALIAIGEQKNFNEGRLLLSGLKMDLLNIEPRLNPFIRDMGLTTIYGTFTTSFKVNPETHNYHWKEISFELHGLAKLSLELKLDQFKPPTAEQWEKLEKLKDNPFGTMSLLSEIEIDKAALEKFEIKYQDFSLLSRVRYSMYKNTQMDVYQMASMSPYVNPLAGRVPASAEKNKMDVILQTFLKNPKVLSFALAPNQKVTFGEMIGKGMLNPKGLIDSLKPQWNVNGQVFEGI